MKQKIIIWLKRYIPAEMSAVIGALIGGLSVNFLFHNPILTAIGGTIGDTVFYYGMIGFRDLKEQKAKHKEITPEIFSKTIRNIILEFGPAEVIDSFFVRPFALYIFPVLLKNVSVGLVAGKIVADGIFYIPTIISYELRIFFAKNKN